LVGIFAVYPKLSPAPAFAATSPEESPDDDEKDPSRATPFFM
jgi:hypothetical protein